MTKKKARAIQRLVKERGVRVIRTGRKMSVSIVNRIIRQIREERYALSIGREPIKRSDLKLETRNLKLILGMP